MSKNKNKKTDEAQVVEAGVVEAVEDVEAVEEVENKNDVAELVEKKELSLVYKVDLYHDGKSYTKGSECKVDAKTQKYFEKNGLVESK